MRRSLLPVLALTISSLTLLHCVIKQEEAQEEGAAAPEVNAGDEAPSGDDTPAGTSGGTPSSGGSSSSSSSSSSSGGAKDGGAKDSGGDGGAASSCAGKALCDTFENQTAGQAPKAPWKIADLTGGAITIDDTKAFSGKKSVKITTTGNAAYKSAFFYADDAKVFPATVVHGRMMVWIDKAPGGGVPWSMISGIGQIPNEQVGGTYRYGGNGTTFMASYDTFGANTGCWKDSQTAVPVKKWVCIEWKFETAKNEMTMSVDGKAVADMKVTNTGDGCTGNDFDGQWRAPNFLQMRFGWESYAADAAQTVWIDDAAVDKVAIGCPK